MADDKSKRGGRDRDRVSADEDYEVRHFANKVGLTVQQVRDLIEQHGNDRKTLEREADKMTKLSDLGPPITSRRHSARCRRKTRPLLRLPSLRSDG